MSQEVCLEGQEGWEKFKYTEESRGGNKDEATEGGKLRNGWKLGEAVADRENKYTLIHSFKVLACQEL